MQTDADNEGLSNMQQSEQPRDLAEQELRAEVELAEKIPLGSSNLWVFVTTNWLPKRWVCIVETAAGQKYCSNKNGLRGFERLLFDVRPDFSQIDSFYKWFAMVGPEGFAVVDSDHSSSLFGVNKDVHDPVEHHGSFDFICRNLEDDTLHRFRVSSDYTLTVDMIEDEPDQ